MHFRSRAGRLPAKRLPTLPTAREPCCPACRATRLLPHPRWTSPAILPDAAQQFANDSGNAARVDQRRTRYSCACCWRWAGKGTAIRSEEHTSELQSLMRISYAVFCLKKKTKLQNNTKHTSSHKYKPHNPTITK